MSSDAVGKINRRLAKHRILIVRGGKIIEQRKAVKSCNPPDIPGFDGKNAIARWEAQ